MKKFLRKKLFLVTSLVSLVAHLPTTVLAMDDESDLLLIASSSRPLLKTQPDINTIVSSTAKRVYAKINANWAYVPPGQGVKMSTESTMWGPQWVEGLSLIEGRKEKTRVPTLILKTSPENFIGALEDLIAKPAVVECTIALTAAKIFVSEKFWEKSFLIFMPLAFISY